MRRTRRSGAAVQRSGWRSRDGSVTRRLPSSHGGGSGVRSTRKRQPRPMLQQLTVKRYKSIYNHTIDLGMFNVFIGENGCGKTNILEAVAMAGAALKGKLDLEELYARGIRVAKPSITFSSFSGARTPAEIKIDLGFFSQEPDLQSDRHQRVELRLAVDNQSPVDVKWVDKSHSASFAFGAHSPAVSMALESLRDDSDHKKQHEVPPTAFFEALKTNLPKKVLSDLIKWVVNSTFRTEIAALVGDFAIYNVNALALRGIHSVSRRAPLGIYGENLDVAISAMSAEQQHDLLERVRCISWLDDFMVDTSDEWKHQGHKLGRSTSTLYFRDKFMPRTNNIFSAENANEGVLHVLFYLALFANESTPKILGIDNIETALNPQLCRDLIKELVVLSKDRGKQALITTHNPAILDGLNLHDDSQRLFVVSRDDNGHTVAERIRLKPESSGGKFKLSELWMRGHIGGIPRGF